MYVSMHVCLDTYICVPTYVYIYIYTYICIHIYIYIYADVCPNSSSVLASGGSYNTIIVA